MQELTQLSFDYSSLDVETRVIVQQRTNEIKSLMKRAAQDIIEIGQKLIEVKQRLGHGNFGNWLEAEFDWHWNTANNFMRVADKFTNFVNLDSFAPSALYLLAENATPEPARLEAINRAEQGETITYTKAKEIVEQHKTIPTRPEVEIEPATPSLPRQVAWQKWGEAITEEYGPGYGPDNFPIGYDPDVLAHSTPAPQSQPMALLASSKNDSWRTPARYIGAAREVMGGIDLDPASSEEANEIIGATYYYTKEDDGLIQPWEGRVWLNPPYGKTRNMSNQGLFADKLASEFGAGNVTEGILLVNLYWSYEWFKPLRNRPLCIPDERITFINPETGEEGDEAKATSVFIYFGKDPEKFYQVFSKFGYCGQLFKR